MEPEKEHVKPKAISKVAIVHCNYGSTDAMVIFYAEGNVDKEISCEKLFCQKRLHKGEKRVIFGQEIEVGKDCWINLPFRTFID